MDFNIGDYVHFHFYGTGKTYDFNGTIIDKTRVGVYILPDEAFEIPSAWVKHKSFPKAFASSPEHCELFLKCDEDDKIDVSNIM